MIDFGSILKRFREANSLSQNEFVDLVTNNDNKLVGLDVVTVSRWENGVVVPAHKKQIEVFKAASQPYFDFIVQNNDLATEPFVSKVIDKSYIWETHEDIDFDRVKCQTINSTDEFGHEMCCLLYSDENGIPVAQLTYKYLPKEEFWKVLNHSADAGHPPDDLHLESDGEMCLQLCSMFCLSNKVLPYMLGVIIHKLLTNKVSVIGFTSNSKKSNLKRFLRLIGFTVHKEEGNNTSLILTYYDALYNKELFYCSILVGVKGDSDASKV